eukprot:g1920.t1
MEVGPIADVMATICDAVEQQAEVQIVMESLIAETEAMTLLADETSLVNRFTVGGIPVEVLAPKQPKRHALVRNSTARIDEVKKLNMRWEPSGPPSIVTGKLPNKKTNKKKRTKKPNVSDTGPAARSNETTVAQPIPAQYRRHLAEQKRQLRTQKVVRLQQKNGSKGLEQLWSNIRKHNSRLGVKHMERPLLRTLRQCFDDADSNHAALLGGALALEAIVENQKMHIELRSQLVLESASRVAQRADLIRGVSRGGGWHILRALVSAVGRLTEDTTNGRPNKHNRLFCINQGALVILVRAMASDVWQKMTRIVEKDPKHQEDEFQMIPRWDDNGLSKTKGSMLMSKQNTEQGDGCNHVVKLNSIEAKMPSVLYRRKSKLSTSKRKGSPTRRGKDLKLLKRQTQLDAIRLLQVWATDKKLRPVLAVGRVLEAALLISGGRRRQLEELDNDGKGRPLTMGRPRYKGTEIQRAANRLLMTFAHRDFEAMESADRRRAIEDFAANADRKVSSMFQLQGDSTPSYLPMTNGRAQTAVGSKIGAPIQSSYSTFSMLSAAASSRDKLQRPHTVATTQSHNIQQTISSAVADISGSSMARDGDRSKRYALNIPVWEAFRDGMLKENMRFKVRELWREEMKYRSILDDRDKRLAIALARSRKQNLRHTKRKIRLNREARIAQLCTPEGRMEEARKLHGIDLIDEHSSDHRLDPGVRRKLLGLSSPPEPEKPKPTIHILPTQTMPEPEPPPIPPRDYFGRCADGGGRAWWENLLVKKKRPTREELALLPYDISKDIEDSNQISSISVGEGFSGGAVHMENGFLPFVGEEAIVLNTTGAEPVVANPYTN